MILNNAWFNRDANVVARELLGKRICREFSNEQIIKLEINETEAYIGPEDAASHAFNNRRTKRTEVMFGDPGTIYMYLIYGMHWMFNLVTGEKDFPAAVLVRSAGEFDGPGKLTRKLEIDKNFNNKVLSVDTGLWIEDAPLIEAGKILSTPRIGINYSPEPWLSAPLRYIIK